MNKRNIVRYSVRLRSLPLYSGREKECKRIDGKVIIRRERKLYNVYRDTQLLGSFGGFEDAKDFVDKYDS